jgi:hypothetical protein
MFLKVEFPDPTSNSSYDVFDIPLGVVHCNIVSELDDEALERQRNWHETNGYEVFTRTMWPANSAGAQIAVVEIIIPGPQPRVVMTNYHATLVRDGGVPMEALFRYRPTVGSASVVNEAASGQVIDRTNEAPAPRKRRATKKTTKRRAGRKTAKRY